MPDSLLTDEDIALFSDKRARHRRLALNLTMIIGGATVMLVLLLNRPLWMLVAFLFATCSVALVGMLLTTRPLHMLQLRYVGFGVLLYGVGLIAALRGRLEVARDAVLLGSILGGIGAFARPWAKVLELRRRGIIGRRSGTPPERV